MANETVPAAQEQKGDNQENADGKPGVPVFSEEQMKRKVLCRTVENDIIEAPWYLMMQSRTFSNMWYSLNIDEGSADQQSNGEPFIFPLNEITTNCFHRILAWMREHHDQPETVVILDPITEERKWFTFTDWERDFFNVDFETVKEYYLAANFLDLKSLYYRCAQECARCIMDKSPEEIRRMLCLPDDLTEAEKDNLRAEFDIPADEANQPSTSGSGGQQQADADMPGTSGGSSSADGAASASNSNPGSQGSA